MWFTFRSIAMLADPVRALAAAILLTACQACAFQNQTGAGNPDLNPACEALAAMYPFAPASEADASLADIANYLKPALSDTRTRSLSTQQHAGQLQSIQGAETLRQAIFQADWTAKHRPVSVKLDSISENLGSATIFSEGRPVLRSFGPRITYRSSWPSNVQHLSIRATDLTGSNPADIEFSGTWTLLRLIDSADEYRVEEDRLIIEVVGPNEGRITLSISGVNDLLDLRHSLICAG